MWKWQKCCGSLNLKKTQRISIPDWRLCLELNEFKVFFNAEAFREALLYLLAEIEEELSLEESAYQSGLWWIAFVTSTSYYSVQCGISIRWGVSMIMIDNLHCSLQFSHERAKQHCFKSWKGHLVTEFVCNVDSSKNACRDPDFDISQIGTFTLQNFCLNIIWLLKVFLISQKKELQISSVRLVETRLLFAWTMFVTKNQQLQLWHGSWITFKARQKEKTCLHL